MEHRRPSSRSSEVARHIHDFSSGPGHWLSLENVKIVDLEPFCFEFSFSDFLNTRCVSNGQNLFSQLGLSSFVDNTSAYIVFIRERLQVLFTSNSVDLLAVTRKHK